MITYKGREIPETLEEILDPKHTVLIVHEMLNDWLSKGGAFDPDARHDAVTEMLPPMIKLVDAARRSNVKVIYAKFTSYADYRTLSDPDILRSYDRIKDPNSRPPVVEGTWGHQVIDELKPQEGDHLLDKYKVDAFVGTNLDPLLRWNGIKTIAIMGVGAFPGILATVSHAYNLGYFIVAPEDCIRGISQPGLSEDAMKFIRLWAIVKPSSDVIRAWADNSS